MPFMRIADENQTLVMTDKSEISKADTNAAILSVLVIRVCVLLHPATLQPSVDGPPEV